MRKKSRLELCLLPFRGQLFLMSHKSRKGGGRPATANGGSKGETFVSGTVGFSARTTEGGDLFVSESACFIGPAPDAHLLHGWETIPHGATCRYPLAHGALVPLKGNCYILIIVQ